MKKSRLIFIVFFAFFSLTSTLYSIEEKEVIQKYLSDINKVLIDVQIASRNLNQKILPLEGAVNKMANSIDNANTLTPPKVLSLQHKMILLSLRKMRMGFYILSKGDRDASVRLVRRGRNLLRLAVKDILEFGKRYGIIKEDKNIENRE